MLFQLTDLEYGIIDSLADGPESLAYLVQELSERQQHWDPADVLRALSGLVGRRLARCPYQAGVQQTTPSDEALQRQYTGVGKHASHEYWFELTESGQTAWQMWRAEQRR